MVQETDIIDVMIVGTGAAGLFCALQFPDDVRVAIITKDEAENSDSFLAQGGICVLRSQEDYDSYFEDTMRAGHYLNEPASVERMILDSPRIIELLIGYGVEFERRGGELAYTREGGHSRPRILFHEDVTGKEITEKLLARARERGNISIWEHVEMLDLLCEGNSCRGIVVMGRDGRVRPAYARDTVLACGGIGGLYRHSTNFPHLTGDGVAVAIRHGIALRDVNFVQIHPTTLYSTKPGRRFLISESVRGEGAVLYNAAGERFVDELQPRDVVTAAIREQMEKDGKPYVWLSMEHIPQDVILGHFPNIHKKCLEEGYDVRKDWIPVVPGQHYFMGGVRSDLDGRTSMGHLYAVGETGCNGVHGANRLASNSLLESMVFARRAALDILSSREEGPWEWQDLFRPGEYEDLDRLRGENHDLVRQEIERRTREYEQQHHDDSAGG